VASANSNFLRLSIVHTNEHYELVAQDGSIDAGHSDVPLTFGNRLVCLHVANRSERHSLLGLDISQGDRESDHSTIFLPGTDALLVPASTEVTTGWKPVGSSAIVGYGLKSFAHEGLV